MKRIILLVLTLACAAVLLCGCAGNADTLASPTPGSGGLMNSLIPGTTDGSGSMPAPQSPGPDTTVLPQTENTMSEEDMSKASEEMADAVGQLSEIDEAYVVAMGDIALVGVRLGAQYQGQVDERVQKMVLARVQTVDKRVTKVAVTADEAQVSKIEEMSRAMGASSAEGDVKTRAEEMMKQLPVYQE